MSADPSQVRHRPLGQPSLAPGGRESPQLALRFSRAQNILPRTLLTDLTDLPWDALRGTPYQPLLPLLSTVSGVPVARLETMLLPRGLDRHSHQFIGNVVYPHCAFCLSEDPQPYYRLSWLSPDLLICPIHQAPLLAGDPKNFAFNIHEIKIFGRTASIDNGFPMPINNGSLPTQHGAVWLQRDLLQPDRQGFALLPSGRRVQRRLLRWFLCVVRRGLREKDDSLYDPTPFEQTLRTSITTQPRTDSWGSSFLTLGTLFTWPPAHVRLSLDAVLPDVQLNQSSPDPTVSRAHHPDRTRIWWMPDATGASNRTAVTASSGDASAARG